MAGTSLIARVPRVEPLLGRHQPQPEKKKPGGFARMLQERLEGENARDSQRESASDISQVFPDEL
jgi:hypothetical protein